MLDEPFPQDDDLVRFESMSHDLDVEPYADIVQVTCALSKSALDRFIACIKIALGTPAQSETQVGQGGMLIDQFLSTIAT